MINRSSLVGKVLLLADRGYESYNNIEHLNNIGWKYLIRVKAPDVHCGLLWKRELPLNLAFDKYITVLLTRRQTNEVKSQPKLYKRLSKYSKFDFLPLESREAYPFSYRIVSIELSSGKFEYLVTNLSQEEMSGEELKEIYHKRWGIETSFRELKHTIGLTNFHSKKSGSYQSGNICKNDIVLLL